MDPCQLGRVIPTENTQEKTAQSLLGNNTTRTYTHTHTHTHTHDGLYLIVGPHATRCMGLIVTPDPINAFVVRYLHTHTHTHTHTCSNNTTQYARAAGSLIHTRLLLSLFF